MIGFSKSSFSSLYAKLYSLQVGAMGGFAGDGALPVTYGAERAGLALGVGNSYKQTKPVVGGAN